MFRELELTWQGESKRLKPTMDLLRYLENRNVGPHRIASLLGSNAAPVATYADFVASVLAYAGYKVTDQDVYDDAHADVNNIRKLRDTVVLFVSCMMPDSVVKTDTAPVKKPTRRATKAP
jgi:hypothetical protein